MKIDRLDGDIQDINNTVAELRAENTALKVSNNALLEKLQELEAYVKQDNLRFYNIEESRGENTETVLKSFISEKLDIDGDDIEFSTVFRQGVPPSNVRHDRHHDVANNRPRCIIARFVRRSDAQRIRAATRKLQGTPFGVSEDLPSEWVKVRKAGYHLFKKAKAEGKTARWRGPRLFINGVRAEITPSTGNENLISTKCQPAPEERPQQDCDHVHQASSPAVTDNFQTKSTGRSLMQSASFERVWQGFVRSVEKERKKEKESETDRPELVSDPESEPESAASSQHSSMALRSKRRVHK